ncbi:uncharacterized protein BT62DRAFT_303826 [Guyanagaster necrorhizus]|uniref:Uncharacterized protein n=1 Tax=Guyanagaster necrorhizus TaxID=856835 RepID=A0A9P7VNN1_9AGAR|nr:uncharacterized protein BT62DRAFT_303826 [Guyanagaster necrorhizus MCA 3950]KAG7443890.1 hypothetical protein BT62DRAFT_303826 [Guyanagaster necrorhizus MCA 3950]
MPKDPVGFVRWFDSLVSKADKTFHRGAVRDEQTNNTFIDVLSAGPSGSTTAMMGHSYLQCNLPWYAPPPVLYAPIPKVIVAVPSWLGGGSLFMLVPHTCIVVDEGKRGPNIEAYLQDQEEPKVHLTER